MNASTAPSGLATQSCSDWGTQMTISMIEPQTEGDRHVADVISYLCPKCGAEARQTVPVAR
jgi:hypothetical protein